MKKLGLVSVIFVFLLFISNGIQAQPAQTELNQVELMKQLSGSWKTDNGNGITGIHENKPFGTGYEGSYKLVINGTEREVKQLWGYNKEMNKFVAAQMAEGMGLELYVTWFTSNTQFKIVPYGDKSNPEGAKLKMEYEFKTPDIFVETITWDNGPATSTTYTRIKK